MPGPNVIGGIGYRLAPQTSGPSVAIFSFKSLKIAAGAQVTVLSNSAGSFPVAFVASNDIDLEGSIDVQGTCMPGSPVAGGYSGGAAAMTTGGDGGGNGKGKGGGSNATGGGGGGGGAYGEAGGKGGDIGGAGGNIGGAGGTLQGDLTVNDPFLFGGAGGGAGGAVNGAATGGAGGSGGGFVQLVSNQQIVLGPSSVINASGCHGATGTADKIGAGGGGAGGGILIEARTLQVNAGTILLANGGAGGGGGNGSSGEDGHSDDTDAASGGGGGSHGTDGGDGGHTTHLAGGNAQAPSGGDTAGGGGGGSVGRIAIKVKSGNPALSGAVMSPVVGEKNGADLPPATLGTTHYN
jgi:hypothetical protein